MELIPGASILDKVTVRTDVFRLFSNPDKEGGAVFMLYLLRIIILDLRIMGLGWLQTQLSLLRTRLYPSCQGTYFIPEIITMSVTVDKLWCPIRAFKWYLERTESLMDTTTKSFYLTKITVFGSRTPCPGGSQR